MQVFLRVVAFVALLIGGLSSVVGLVEIASGANLGGRYRPAGLHPDAIRWLGLERLWISVPWLLLGWLCAHAARRRRRPRAEAPATEPVSGLPVRADGVVARSPAEPIHPTQETIRLSRVDEVPGAPNPPDARFGVAVIVGLIAVPFVVMAIVNLRDGVAGRPLDSPPRSSRPGSAARPPAPPPRLRRRPPQSGPTEPAAGRAPLLRNEPSDRQRGTFDGSTYTNREFGITIDLPHLWTLPDIDTRRAVAESMAPVVFKDPAAQRSMIESVESTEDEVTLFMCVSGERSGASIAMKAMRFTGDVDGVTPTANDLLRYFAAHSAAMFRGQYRVGPVESVELGGMRWDRIQLQLRAFDTTQRLGCFARRRGDWFILLVTNDRTVGERAQILESLRSVRCW